MFDINKFDQKAFQKTFDAALKKLSGAEKITKELLGALSRSVLEQMHTNEDIRPVNALLAALTPMNRKTATLYFRGLSGFKFDEELEKFTEKNKTTYPKARAASEEFLADPENTLWTWADKHVEVKSSEFTLAKVTAGMESYIKKAKKNNFSQLDVLIAAMAAGFTQEDLIAAMAHLADKAEEVKAAANDEAAKKAA